MDRPILIAIGGNSLIRAGQKGTIAEQCDNAAITARYIAALVAQGHHVLITHGNGPQVGAELLRSELASSQVYTLPLDSCVASTQGEMGYILENALRTALRSMNFDTSVVSILTQVVVDASDPAFLHPTKPIGPFYSREVAEQRRMEGWQIIEDASRGYRRVVPSPKPVRIVELESINACIDQGMVVIALGGGGIPVIAENGRYRGVEAVIDKDRASALLAKELHLKRFVISTDTDRVYLNYRKPQQTALCRMSVQQACDYLREGQFPAGSMGPKIESAVDFLTNGGEEVIITDPAHLAEAVSGDAGTHISSR